MRSLVVNKYKKKMKMKTNRKIDMKIAESRKRTPTKQKANNKPPSSSQQKPLNH